MNAPIHPALLAPAVDLREFALRVAQTTRIDCAIAARGDQLAMQMRGHGTVAAAHETAHAAVMRIDIEALVTELTGQPRADSGADELDAFYEASRLAGMGERRGQNGEPTQPMAQKGRSVWNAALRWARNQREGPF